MNDERGNASRQPAGTPGATRFATRGNHRLSYESSGADDGPAVIALHDLLCDRGAFRALGEILRDHGCRIVLPDARGHGASPMIAGRVYPIHELAADAAAVLDAEGLAVVDVVAVGWGAVVALELAHMAPERVASMVLAAPYVPGLLATHASGDLRDEGVRHLEALASATTGAEKGQVDRALDLVLDVRLSAGWRERLPKPRLAVIRRSAASLGPLLTGTMADPPSRDALASIGVSTTILVPASDPTMARQMGEFLASLLPQAHIAAVGLDPEALSAPGAEAAAAIFGALRGDG